MNDQSQKIFFNAVVGVITATVASWILFFNQFFILPEHDKLKAIGYAVALTFHKPLYLLILIIVFTISCIVAWYYYQYNKTPFGGERYIRVLRGLQLVSKFKLEKMVTEKNSYQISFCGLPVPQDLKYKHFLLTGGTGQGKSQAINRFLASCVENVESKTRLIIIDPNGGFASSFYKKGDVIFNPFDARSPSWSVLNEVFNKYDIENYALTVIPQSSDPNHESFNVMARTVVQATMERVLSVSDITQEQKVQLFYDTLTKTSNDELKAFLYGTSAYSMLGNDDLVGSIRSIITTKLTSHQHCKVGSFSFREYLKNGTGNIFITWREDQVTALKPIISCVTDVICSALLSDFDNYFDFVFCIDELGTLDRLSYLEPVLTKGRKHRLIALAGVQSLAQFNRIYGKEDAITLRGCFSSFAVCTLNSQDTYSPQEFQKAFGEIEVLRKMKSTTKDARAEIAKEKESVVKAYEISSLKPLNFYLKFSGHYPPSLIKLPHRNYPKVIDSFLPV